MSRLGNILNALANIGKTYSAAWTATSTSGTTPLTNSITLPKGTYIVVASSPYVASGAAGVMELRIDGTQQADKLISAPVGNYTKGAFIIELDSQSTIQLYSGGSSTTNYQVIERGSLKAVRISGGGYITALSHLVTSVRRWSHEQARKHTYCNHRLDKGTVSRHNNNLVVYDDRKWGTLCIPDCNERRVLPIGNLRLGNYRKLYRLVRDEQSETGRSAIRLSKNSWLHNKPWKQWCHLDYYGSSSLEERGIAYISERGCVA